MTAADIAAASGIEEWVIREKFGIPETRARPERPHQPDGDLGRAGLPGPLRHQAGRDRCGPLHHRGVEGVLLWTAGIKLAYEIGATRAWAMDVQMRCGTTIAALNWRRDMMIADPRSIPS